MELGRMLFGGDVCINIIGLGDPAIFMTFILSIALTRAAGQVTPPILVHELISTLFDDARFGILELQKPEYPVQVDQKRCCKHPSSNKVPIIRLTDSDALSPVSRATNRRFATNTPTCIGRIRAAAAWPEQICKQLHMARQVRSPANGSGLESCVEWQHGVPEDTVSAK
jgi:hypothetical protein